MGYVYTKEFEIMTGMLDQQYRLKPTAAIELFQEMALGHSHALGYSLDWFHERQKGWMLLDWHIKFHHFPSCYEKIHAKTWTSMYKRIQAMRSFELNTNEQPLATALSRWVYMDLDRKRPVRVPEEMANNYSVEQPLAIEPPRFLQDINGDISSGCKEEIWTVHRRELDFNNHVNNIKYVEWAIDYVPDEIYQTCQVAELKVAYKKECLLGDILNGYFYVEEYPEQYHTFARICKKGDVCCQVFICWNKMNPAAV